MADRRNRAAGLGTAGGALAFCMARFLLAQTAPAVDFQREIRPILSDNCFQCHGPDSAARQAGLRLDRRESALEVRPNGAPIVPGKSAESLLYQRISDPDANLRMPPPDSHKRLTAVQIANQLCASVLSQGKFGGPVGATKTVRIAGRGVVAYVTVRRVR